MILLIPYKHISIITSLTIKEAVDTVSNAISSPRQSWLQKTTKSRRGFEGTVSNKGFRISRVLPYRNVLLPVLYGSFHPTNNGIRVDIHLTLHPVMLLSLAAFSVFWCSGLVWALLVFVSTSFTLNSFNTGMVASASVVFFVYLLTTLIFNLEAIKAAQFINDLFDAYKLDWTVS